MTTTVVSTIRSSGGDYTTLSAWEAGEQKNLTTADEISVAECYDDWGSGLSDEVNISGWTVDSTRYIKVTVASGHRHNGTPQSGFFIKKSSTGSSVVINQHPYTVLEWLDVEQTSTSSTKYALRHFGSLSGTPVTRNCIAKNASSDQPAFGDSGSQTFISCLAWGGYAGFSNAGATKAYNCIAANCTTGFGGTGGTGTAYNCIAYNNTTNWANGWKAGDYGSNNATSTGSDDAPGGSSVYGITSGNFVNSASNDFHLATGANSLVGAGINKYSVLTTDIDGDTWPSSGAWDIGFDYRVASATTIAADVAQGAATGLTSGVSNGNNIGAIVGLSDASGLASAIYTHVSIAAGIAQASASGASADVANNITITCSVAQGLADGLDAAVNTSGSSTISCSVGSAGAAGLTAAIDASTQIAALLGVGEASGYPANLTLSINASVADGTASGHTAIIVAVTSVICVTGVASADGLSATVTTAGAGVTLSPEDIAAIADAVWADPVAIAAHAKLDAIIARITC